MLSTRIRATSKMNVNRLIELQFLLQVPGQEHRMTLGVGRCPLTSSVSCTGNQSAGDRGRRVVETHLDQALFHRLNEMVRYIRDEQILPDSKANFSGAVILRHISNPAHLLWLHPADRNNHTDIVQTRLNLFIHSDVTVLNRHRWRLALVNRKT